MKFLLLAEKGQKDLYLESKAKAKFEAQRGENAKMLDFV